jgi:hypothetical protein
MKDSLSDFREWEGQDLGEDTDLKPGFYGLTKPPRLALHFAGAHVTSTARRDRYNVLHPAVWIKLAVKQIGTETYHVVEGMMDAEIATEFAEALALGAERAPLDIQAIRKKNA